jgi:pimeloyl-ACP methyl ester carboxylesterase
VLKRYTRIIFSFPLLLAVFTIFPEMQLAQTSVKTTIYLFPGQGSDERIFAELKPDSEYTFVSIKYPVPEKKTSLKQYARQVSTQIDTTGPYIFIGVSLGGMICTELTETMKPQKTIIISSAKCRNELPFRYKFQKAIPIYKLVPRGLIKGGARMLQPIVEPDRKKNKAVFKSMLRSKDKRYLKRTVAMIITWDRKTFSDKIIHIHGTKDHTLPYRKVKCNYTVKKGSHMMTLTRGSEINGLIHEILRSKD